MNNMPKGRDASLSVDDVMQRIDSLPTLPLVAIEVGELVNNPDAGADAVAAVMRRDPSLSAKVLKLVNSPYYGIPGGVTDVQRAISFIGFNALHQLVLSVSVLRALRTPAGSKFNASGLWLHSLGVGACSQVIAEHIRHQDPGSCFTAGLLHDVGKIALAIGAPERFGTALDDAKNNGKLMAKAEREAGLPSHDRIGSKLARKWKFPAPLIMPIEHHHSVDRPQVRRELTKDLLSLVDIVNVADHLVRGFKIGDGGSPVPEGRDTEALERVGLSTIQSGSIYTKLMKQLEVSRMFLQLVDYDDSADSKEPVSSSGADADAGASARGNETMNRAPRSGARS